MPEKARILVLEDSPVDAELVRRLLSKEIQDFEFNLALDKDSFLYALENFDPNVILADNSLPEFCARDALEIAHRQIPGIPFILVTGSVSEEFAAEIIKLGADDYILKDRMIRLPAAIETAMKQRKARQEKKEALEGHRRSDERFQTLSRATKDAVWDWNLITGETWWNESFYALLGYDPKLPAPGPDAWSKLIHPSDRPKVMARLKGIVKSGVPSWEDEFRLRLSDGSYGTVLDRAYVVEDDSGEPVRVIGALVNITEQKRVTKEMEILSLIARETSNSVMVFNRHDGYTSWVNQAFTRYTGYTQQDLIGREPWSILRGPGTDKDTLIFINQQIRSNVPFSCDVLIYSRKGEEKWQSVTGEPMSDFDIHAANYFVIATDISERRRIEEERLTDKMEQQREVSRVILQTQEVERNNLGRELHDNINQILAAVNLKLAFFLEEPDGNLEIIEICRKELTKAILEARNLSRHMVIPRFSEMNLKDELEMLLENYSTDWTVRLDFDIANEKDISSAIKVALFRILQEQLTNIMKHAGASEIGLHLDDKAYRISMTIQDNGVGFDTQQRRKGIGFTNIYNRVESYNGILDITSLPGQGCTLSLSIPLSG